MKHTQPRTLRLLTAAALLQVAHLCTTSDATACGGLFCDNAAPVFQTAERILFAKGDDGTVTQVVEILYQGPASQFAWVLPVPGIPQVGVSSKLVFDRLQSATDPSYQMNIESSCDQGNAQGDGDAGGDGDGDISLGEGDGSGGVNVLDSGSVGPYDYETLSVDAADEDPAEVAVTWLKDNGYAVGELGPDVLRPYLANGLNLIAFRLSKSASTGAIRPVTLTYQARGLAIPIRPTAVAANDDMGVLVWLLGKDRAVPINYKGLELNEMFINWMNPQPTYNSVVSRAADEAGGQGFVTEMAGAAESLAQTITFDGEFRRASDFEDENQNIAQILAQLTNQYATYDGFLDTIRAQVKFHEGATAEDFVACPSCYADVPAVDANFNNVYVVGADDPIYDTDMPAFFEALETNVYAPIEEFAQLFDEHAYVTRLYTTMSAGEMTEDPTFDFNPELDDVSNVHTSKVLLGCSGFDGPWRLTLPSGTKVYGEGFTWPFSETDPGELPLNDRVVAFSTSGPPKILNNNRKTIASLFDALPASKSNGVDEGRGSDGLTNGDGSGSADAAGGCSVGGAGNKGALWATGALGLALLLLSRRRGVLGKAN